MYKLTNGKLILANREAHFIFFFLFSSFKSAFRETYTQINPKSIMFRSFCSEKVTTYIYIYIVPIPCKSPNLRSRAPHFARCFRLALPLFPHRHLPRSDSVTQPLQLFNSLIPSS